MDRITLEDIFPAGTPEETPQRENRDADGEGDRTARIRPEGDSRNCCGCGSVFARPPSDVFVPLNCRSCEEKHGEWLRANDPLYGNFKGRWRPTFDADGTRKGTLIMRHARYSPSTLGSREKCPGWTSDNDPSKNTEVADRGTAIHEAIEKDDTSKLAAADDIQCALNCIEFVDEIAEQYPVHERFREIQVKVLDQFGTVDDLIVAGQVGHMTDYKTGWWPVPDAEINLQMQSYALGVFDRFPKLDTLHVHILLPRQATISDATFTREAHYKTLKQRVFKAIEGAKAVDQLFAEGSVDKLLSTLSPSSTNCEFCGRKAQCPALNKLALAIAERFDPSMILPEGDLHGSQITDPLVMARALQIAPIMESWAASIKRGALEMRMASGIEIPGYDLAERKGSRKITDPQAAWESVKDIISPDEFAACADVSMPDLEAAVAAKAPRGKKAATKQQLEDQLRDRGALKEASTVHYLKRIRTNPAATAIGNN